MHTSKYKKIVLEYKNLVYSQALYSSGNRHDAADITQDVFMKLWKNIDNIRPDTVKSWLFKVTRNCCIDLKRKKKEQYFSEFTEDGEKSIVNSLSNKDEPGPEHEYNNAEIKQHLLTEIKKLPEKIGTALILRHIHGEPYEAIAEIIGCPVNSIKVYLHRGRNMLALALEKPAKN